MLFKASVLSALVCGATAQNSTCAGPAGTGKYSDDQVLAEFDGLAVDQCCDKCEGSDACKAWSYEESALLHKSHCYLHASTDLPHDQNKDWKCAIKPLVPTPPPAPTPAPGPFAGDNWAVIIAGSKTFQNYRHQADACHAYQVVKKNGIPESNIILMMEDDVAGARENPFPGKMFNKPTAKGEPGVDVYAGCVPDYKGADVTAKTFLAVLSGDTANVKGKGNGKVLKSTKADNVFVNFADHGGGEIVEMPNGPYLHASDLVNTLKQMNTNSMFRKLVFYMEACNGGSMFANLLPKDINVFATTAANPTEPSWGTYCPPDDMIDGKHVGSCLGDLYSVNWMEDSDAQGEKKTLEQQFQTVVKLTNKSHPTEYGDKTFTSDEVHTYQGHGSANTTVTTATGPAARKTPVDQRDIELLQMFYSYMRSDETAEGAKKQSLTAADASKRSGLALELMSLVQKREADDKLFAGMLAGLATAAATAEGFEPPLKSSPTHAQCVKSVTNEVVDKCGGFTSYSLRYHADLVSYCAKMPAAGVAFVVDKACA